MLTIRGAKFTKNWFQVNNQQYKYCELNVQAFSHDELAQIRAVMKG